MGVQIGAAHGRRMRARLSFIARGARAGHAATQLPTMTLYRVPAAACAVYISVAHLHTAHLFSHRTLAPDVPCAWRAACTTVPNKATDATYSCTTADDSQLSASDSAFVLPTALRLSMLSTAYFVLFPRTV